MFRRTAALSLTLLFASASILSAQDVTDPITRNTTSLTEAVGHAAVNDDRAPVTLWSLSQPPQKRPTMLPVLYGSYGLLQAMDIVSTKRAIDAGAHEANPLAKGGNLGTTIAIKAATGAATFYAAEKLWKKNRTGAVVLMVVANSLSAAVVAHNQRNAHK